MYTNDIPDPVTGVPYACPRTRKDGEYCPFHDKYYYKSHRDEVMAQSGTWPGPDSGTGPIGRDVATPYHGLTMPSGSTSVLMGGRPLSAAAGFGRGPPALLGDASNGHHGYRTGMPRPPETARRRQDAGVPDPAEPVPAVGPPPDESLNPCRGDPDRWQRRPP